jgi:hypothetical protein
MAFVYQITMSMSIPNYRSLTPIPLQIMEEFSEKDIKEAVAELRSYGKESALLEFLAKQQQERAPSGDVDRPKKALSQQHSKLLTEIAGVDQEKFKILSEFDDLLKREKILLRVEDIRELGNRISKNFPKVKSRKEAIPKLLRILSEKPVEELRQILQGALSQKNVASQTSEYQELANYIK